MGVFDKSQRRKKRLIKKRANTARAAKAELNAGTELNRMILAALIMQDEMIFSPHRYYDLLLELSGEDPEPVEYDSQMYWVIVSKLRKLDAWIHNLDPKGKQWEFNLDYALRVRKQVADGELPAISLWLDALPSELEPVVTETGKVLGDAIDDIQRDSGPAAEGGTLHGDEP